MPNAVIPEISHDLGVKVSIDSSKNIELPYTNSVEENFPLILSQHLSQYSKELLIA
jgi:hypothetical protein